MDTMDSNMERVGLCKIDNGKIYTNSLDYNIIAAKYLLWQTRSQFIDNKPLLYNNVKITKL